jgi:hypothetical protein
LSLHIAVGEKLNRLKMNKGRMKNKIEDDRKLERRMGKTMGK